MARVLGQIQVGAQKDTVTGVIMWRPTIWFVSDTGAQTVEWQGDVYYQSREQAASIAFDKFEALLAEGKKVRYD